MYQRLDRSHENILGYELGGTIGEEDYQQLVREVRAVIAAHGSVRILVRARGLPGTEASTINDRFRFAKDHLHDIDRMAVVGEHKGLEWLTKATDKVLSVHMRHFPPEDEEAAWTWLGADPAPGSG